MTLRHYLRWEALLPPAFFLALTGLVAFPWFREPGLLFLLDFVWPPQLQPPTELWKTGLIMSLPHEWLWWALGMMIPTATVQKLALSLPLLLSGLSMTSLTRWLLSHTRSGAPVSGTAWAPTLAALAAGTFYAFNPFLVTRIFMGQLYLILAYALTPWALLTLLKALYEPTRRRATVAGLTTAGVMLTNAHHLFLLPVLLLPFFACSGRRRLRPATLGWFFLPIAVLVLAAALVQRSPGASTVTFDALGPWARALRAPFTDNLLLDTLALTATWKVDLPFAFPYEMFPRFAILLLACLGLIALGVVRFARHDALGWIIRSLLVVALVSVALAIGVAHPLTEPLAAFLYRTVPFFLGMRDSAKFLALVALAESALLGLGVVAATERALTARGSLTRRAAAVLPSFVLVLVLGFAAPAMRGFQEQLLPSQYPESWTAWNVRLASHHDRPASAKASVDKPRMLFLPWHQYLPLSFTDDRTVVNPSPRFFTNAEVIAGDNSEVGGTYGRPFIYSESHRPLSKRLEPILKDAPVRDDIGSRIAPEGIQYVALATDSIDSASYDYLSHQADFRRIFESPELTVWKVGPLHPSKQLRGP